MAAAAAAAASSSSSAGGSSPAPAPTQASGGGGEGGGGGVPYHRSRFGDTTLTKVFVGGLAWETPSQGLHDHFREHGDILEAVVITDRETGRSKGYGFVTFRDAESARQAVQDPNPVIAGRRANCNIASMGPPRPSPQRDGGAQFQLLKAIKHWVTAHGKQDRRLRGPRLRWEGRQARTGRAPRGSHLPDQQPLGPPPYMGGRMQSQQQVATPPHAVFYPSQYGYWYPPEYTYQQAVYNSQLQHYYPQLYGPTSPSTSPYPYMGYMPGAPGQRAGFSPMQQPGRPQFFQQPTAQLEGSFQTAPSLPPTFRLQLPPRAVSRQSDDISGLQSTQPNPATADTSTDNQEASTPVNRSNSDLNTSN